MCGILAVISKRAYGFVGKDITAFEQLLYADSLRGEDSTGVIGVDKYGDMYIDKSADDAHDFLLQWVGKSSHKDIQKDGVALIGHNRKGTVGKISDATAHPFVVKERFALVHNGTLYNHSALHKTDVDSEALAMHIEEAMNSTDSNHITLATALEDVWGAYACVWYNQVTDKVQFVRNSQRPMWIAETDDAWYLSSEGSMLHWILGRNGIAYKSLASTEEDTLYTLKPGTASPLVKETLPEKKAPPTPTSPVGVGTGTTTATSATDGSQKTLGNISKNRFKKLNKKMQGKRLEFWIMDYVERYPFQKNEAQTEFLIMGECDGLSELKHVVRGNIDINEQEILDIDSVDNYYFIGTVSHTTYDPRLKQLEIHMKDIKKLPPSIPNKDAQYEKTTVTIH